MYKVYKHVVVFGLFIILFACRAFADEGMWLISLLNEMKMKELQQRGLELNAEELFSTSQISLKDAIVAIDGGSCTGSIVSSEGLLFTNHHCGYSEVQKHSSVEHDYLKNGFWARTKADELPNPGKSVSFLIDVKEVTKKVNDLKQEQFNKGIKKPNVRRIKHRIAREAVKGTSYHAEVHAMFNGNSYFLFVYQTYYDVRLVAAPPSEIGNYGGETDNWVWPRHTADFTFFRVYTAPDGTPAKYSPENIPLKPKRFLQIDASGVQEGDFSFIMGYPGKTKRYITSYAIDEIIHVTSPISMVMRNNKLDVLRKEMKKNEEVKIKYASKFASLSNYWKYDVGQNKCLKKYNTMMEKRMLELDYQKWVANDGSRQRKYGDVLPEIERAYTAKREITQAVKYYNEAIYMGPEIFKFASRLKRLQREMAKGNIDDRKMEQQVTALLNNYKALYKDFDVQIDKLIFSAALQYFVENIDREYLPEEFCKIAESYRWNMSKLADWLYDETVFTDFSKLQNYLQSLSLKDTIYDPVMDIAFPLQAQASLLNKKERPYEIIIRDNNKLFVEGLLEMNRGKALYPDANSTMRLTYGNVGGYKAADAIYYKYYTTIDGIMEKHASDSLVYSIPPRLKSLYEARDFGKYEEDGTVRTCFLTNHDITGGNSGSPVLNARGELVGIAFDGNWEAMSGDISFNSEKQKCINADIRYILFIIDKYANAQNILNELSIKR